MKLDYPIMLAALGISAAIQEVLPAIPFGEPELKAQFLPAVALYYLRHRPWSLSLTAALWAGVLMDALGGLPFGASSLSLLFFGLFIIVFRRQTIKSSPISALVPGMVLSLPLGIVQILAYNFSSDVVSPLPFFAAFLGFVKLLPLAGIIAVVVDAILSRADRDAGNVETLQEEVVS